MGAATWSALVHVRTSKTAMLTLATCVVVLGPFLFVASAILLLGLACCVPVMITGFTIAWFPALLRTLRVAARALHAWVSAQLESEALQQLQQACRAHPLITVTCVVGALSCLPLIMVRVRPDHRQRTPPIASKRRRLLWHSRCAPSSSSRPSPCLPPCSPTATSWVLRRPPSPMRLHKQRRANLPTRLLPLDATRHVSRALAQNVAVPSWRQLVGFLSGRTTTASVLLRARDARRPEPLRVESASPSRGILGRTTGRARRAPRRGRVP